MENFKKVNRIDDIKEEIEQMKMLYELNCETESKIDRDMVKVAGQNRMLKLQNMNLDGHARILKNTLQKKIEIRDGYKNGAGGEIQLIEELQKTHSQLKNAQTFDIKYDETLFMGIVKNAIKLDKAATMSVICIIADNISIKKPPSIIDKINKIRHKLYPSNITVYLILKQLKAEQCAICMDPIYDDIKC